MAGGAISAATAGALTAALGEAYIIILTRISEGEMNIEDLTTRKGKEAMKTVFSEQLKVNRNISQN